MDPYVSEALADAWTRERIAEAAAWRRARLASAREAHLREAVRRIAVRTVSAWAEALRPARPVRGKECRRASG